MPDDISDDVFDFDLLELNLPEAAQGKGYGAGAGGGRYKSTPVMSDANFNLSEGVTAIGSVIATDDDKHDSISYSFADGSQTYEAPDGAIFNIDAETGEITSTEPLNYESSTSYSFNVMATDLGGNTDVATVTINLSDLNEYPVTVPVDVDSASNSVQEGAPANTEVGLKAFSTDQDGTTNTVTYALVTDASGTTELTDGPFQIDPYTGLVTVQDGSQIDYETASTQTVFIKATSADGSEAVQSFDITVVDAIEPISLAFQAVPSPDVGDHPQGVTSADINNDGDIDLLITNSGDNTVSVLLGNGDGTFQDQIIYAAGATPYGIASADLNSDNKLDMVVGNYASGTITVFLGNGDGTFEEEQTYAAGQGTAGLFVADLDADGKFDVAVSNEFSDVAIFLGNGDGTLQAQQSVAAASGQTDVTGTDINGDGVVDLITANYLSDSISVLIGNGDGTFQEQHTYSSPGPRTISVDDVNGDGAQDLLVANLRADEVSVLLGEGDGSFQPAQAFATSSGSWSLTVADVNLDGETDIVIAGGSLSVLLGNGDGTFQSYQNFASGSMRIVTATDINNDDRIDLVAPNTVDLTILLNEGQPLNEASIADTYEPSLIEHPPDFII